MLESDGLKVFSQNEGVGIATTGFSHPTTGSFSTQHFNIYYEPSLGDAGAAISSFLQGRCETDYQSLSEWFGLTVDHFNIIVAPLSHQRDGSGGAFHHSCLATDLYCDACVNPPPGVPAVSAALAVAEAVEVFEANQNRGWACGASNGEGLSRVLAQDLYPGILDGIGGGAYLTAKAWLTGGKPDWVNYTATTDRSTIANGCAVLFLFWMRYVWNFTWAHICQSPADTLSGTYWTLTGQKDAFTTFMTDISLLGDVEFDGDDPFKRALSEGRIKSRANLIAGVSGPSV